MSPNAQRLLDEARQLPPDERKWFTEQLLIGVNEEAFATLARDYGEPEPGYDDWFRKGVEESLADSSDGIPHEEAMKRFHTAIQRARKLKKSA